MHNISSPDNSDRGIEHAILAAGLTAPRVTPAQIESLMARVVYKNEYFHTSTLIHAFLDGEFYLASGHSACISLDNYNKEIGDRIALQDAKEKTSKQLWLLEGYALRKKLNEDRHAEVNRRFAEILGPIEHVPATCTFCRNGG